MKKIVCEAEYAEGHLRNGHYEMELSDEEYERFMNLPKDEQYREIRHNADQVVDDWEIDDFGWPMGDVDVVDI